MFQKNKLQFQISMGNIKSKSDKMFPNFKLHDAQHAVNCKSINRTINAELCQTGVRGSYNYSS